MIPLDAIRQAIKAATGSLPDGQLIPVGGGCINETYRFGGYFLKVGDASRLAMFESERVGLQAIADTGTIRIPAPVFCHALANHAVLVLEHLPLTGGTSASEETLGRKLAAMHRCTSEQFGWTMDNFIGSTPQPNPPTGSWVEFLRDHRLGHLFDLAAQAGYHFENSRILLDHLDRFFDDGEPEPSLLHGDLWGGNAAALPDGTPVIFDPAVYFGDREADLAMTTLFGGFSDHFYRAYNEAWPLPRGYRRRKQLYNLYHILNHAILFGSSYAHQSQTMIDDLVAST